MSIKISNSGKAINVYMYHISLQIPLLCMLEEVENKSFIVNCSRHVPNIIIGDPIICKYMDSEHEYILTGDVTDIYSRSSFRILITNKQIYKNNRRNPRFCVSLTSVVAGVDSLNYLCSTVKSISRSGVALNCKHSFEIGDLLIVNIITSPDDVIAITGCIVRKIPILDYYEYGVNIAKIDTVNQEKLKRYIAHLGNEEKNFKMNTHTAI